MSRSIGFRFSILNINNKYIVINHFQFQGKFEIVFVAKRDGTFEINPKYCVVELKWAQHIIDSHILIRPSQTAYTYVHLFI